MVCVCLMQNETVNIEQLYRHNCKQGDHSPDNVKFPDISLMVPSTPPRHSAC